MLNSNVPILVFNPPFEWMEIEGCIYKKLGSGLLIKA